MSHSADGITIVIPGNTPSLKNSKQVFRNPTGKRPIVTKSKAYKAWLELAEPTIKYDYSYLVGRLWSYPLLIDFTFYRKSRHHFDYINVAQGPLDLLVDQGIIDDDDMDHVIPGAWHWQLEKENPRVVMIIHELGAD